MYFPIYTQEAGNIILTYNNFPSTHTKYVYLPSETNAVQQLKASTLRKSLVYFSKQETAVSKFTGLQNDGAMTGCVALKLMLTDHAHEMQIKFMLVTMMCCLCSLCLSLPNCHDRRNLQSYTCKASLLGTH